MARLRGPATCSAPKSRQQRATASALLVTEQRVTCRGGGELLALDSVRNISGRAHEPLNAKSVAMGTGKVVGWPSEAVGNSPQSKLQAESPRPGHHVPMVAGEGQGVRRLPGRGRDKLAGTGPNRQARSVGERPAPRRLRSACRPVRCCRQRSYCSR